MNRAKYFFWQECGALTGKRVKNVAKSTKVMTHSSSVCDLACGSISLVVMSFLSSHISSFLNFSSIYSATSQFTFRRFLFPQVHSPRCRDWP